MLSRKKRDGKMTPYAFVFPGQGSQELRMAQQVCARYSVSKQLLREAEDVLGRSLSSVMFGDDRGLLDRTENTQVCLAVAECCIALALSDRGLQPSALLGFSLGEWVALWFGGSIHFADMLEAIDVRARAMQSSVRLGGGQMVAVVGLSSDEIAAVCMKLDRVWPANYNSPLQTVISGEVEDVDKACLRLAEAGAITKKLSVSVPSHCPLMAPAKDELEKHLELVDFQFPNVPIVSNRTGKLIAESDDIKRLILEQMVEPVLLTEGVRSLAELGIDTVIEVGPGSILGKLIRKNDKSILAYKAGTPEDIDFLVDKLSEQGNGGRKDVV